MGWPPGTQSTKAVLSEDLDMFRDGEHAWELHTVRLPGATDMWGWIHGEGHIVFRTFHYSYIPPSDDTILTHYPRMALFVVAGTRF